MKALTIDETILKVLLMFDSSGIPSSRFELNFRNGRYFARANLVGGGDLVRGGGECGGDTPEEAKRELLRVILAKATQMQHQYEAQAKEASEASDAILEILSEFKLKTK